jgi:hypothetical protein
LSFLNFNNDQGIKNINISIIVTIK